MDPHQAKRIALASHRIGEAQRRLTHVGRALADPAPRWNPTDAEVVAAAKELLAAREEEHRAITGAPEPD